MRESLSTVDAFFFFSLSFSYILFSLILFPYLGDASEAAKCGLIVNSVRNCFTGLKTVDERAKSFRVAATSYHNRRRERERESTK